MATLGGGNDDHVGTDGEHGVDAGSGSNNTVDFSHSTTDHVIVGDGSGDTLLGGGGNDSLAASGSGQHIDAGGGDNQIYVSQTVNDTIIGGSGNDQLGGSHITDNTINLGGGDNIVNFTDFTGSNLYVDNSGTLQAEILNALNNTVHGGDSGDAINLGGNSNSNIVIGGGGSDSVIAGGTNNFIGVGSDTSTGAGSNVHVTGSGNVVGGGGGGDNIGSTGDNAVTGGAGDDHLYGTGGTLSGGSGNDTIDALNGGTHLVGGSGNDVLNAAGYGDTMQGGGGADTFHFDAGAGSAVIVDFSVAQGDTLSFSAGDYGNGFTLASGSAGVDQIINHASADPDTGVVSISIGGETVVVHGLTMEQLQGPDAHTFIHVS